MGRNATLRRQLEGQVRALEEHRAKIEAEVLKPNPDPANIKQWEDTVRNVEQRIAKLQRRLAR